MTRRLPPWPVVVITAVCLTVYGSLDLVRYLTYHAPAYDLAFFDQLCENLAAGRGFSSSFVTYDFLGQHWEPLLWGWSLLDRISATPVWLIAVNSIALALAPWAAWRLARAWVPQSPRLAMLAALLTALNPLVLRTAVFDYHTEALTPLLTLLALEAAHRRRWVVLALCTVPLLLVKEDALLVLAGAGWVMWTVDGVRAGLLISAAALVAFLVLITVVMPDLRGAEASSDLLLRYAYLDPSQPPTAAGVLQGLITHPGTWIRHLLSPAPAEGLLVALLPLWLLPLAAGRAVLAVVPVLGVALLADDPIQQALDLHYGIEAFPLLLACALIGAARLRLPERAGRAAPYAVGVLLLATAVAGLSNLSHTSFDGLQRRDAVEALLSQVPAGASVSASTGLTPHLSDRPQLYEFPNLADAEYVVIDTEVAPSTLSRLAGFMAQLADLPQSYTVVASADGVTVWRHR